MSIIIGDGQLPVFNTDGDLNDTIGAVTGSLIGNSVTAPSDFDGSFNVSTEAVTARFRSTTDGLLYPLCAAGRVGQRDWADNDGSSGGPVVTQSSAELFNMSSMDFAVIQGQVSRGSEFVRAVQQYLADSKALNPAHQTCIYFIQNEISTGLNGDKHDLMVSFDGPPGASIASGSLVPENCAYARDAAGELTSSFAGTYLLNVTTYVQTDSSGRYPTEAYIDDVWPQSYATPYTNLDGWFIDVFDYAPKISGTDYNGDGTSDNADDAWNDGGLSEAIADSYRRGQALGCRRVLDSQPGKLVIANGTDHQREDTTENPNAWLNNKGINDNYPEYQGLYHGCWQEEMLSFAGRSFLGQDWEGKLTSFGSPRLAWNSLRHHMQYCLPPKYVMASATFNSTSVARDPTVGQNGVTSDTMCAIRMVAAMAAQDDVYLTLGNSVNGGSRYNRTPVINEMGIRDSSTTGLFRGWLGQPVDDTLTSKEVAASGATPWITVGTVDIYKREYENGVALCIWGKPSGSNGDAITDTVTIPIDDAASDFTGGAIPGNEFRTFNGTQDPAVNDNTIINEARGLTMRVMNGLFLVRN